MSIINNLTLNVLNRYKYMNYGIPSVKAYVKAYWA